MADPCLDRAAASLHSMFTEARGFATFEAVSDIAGTSRFLATGHATAPDVHVFVYAGKLGVQVLRSLAPVLLGCAHAMVAYGHTITSHARLELKRLAVGRVIETFNLYALQFNLMAHVCVADHCALAAPAIRALGLVSAQLPDLLRSDPVARWHHWLPGTVVRTTMSNPEGHTFYEYRKVV